MIQHNAIVIPKDPTPTSAAKADDKKDEKVVSICCSNQKHLKDDEFDLAYTMIDLLNQEIIKTVKFMLELY